jgi:hypothetical protein
MARDNRGYFVEVLDHVVGQPKFDGVFLAAQLRGAHDALPRNTGLARDLRLGVDDALHGIGMGMRNRIDREREMFDHASGKPRRNRAAQA